MDRSLSGHRFMRGDARDAPRLPLLSRDGDGSMTHRHRHGVVTANKADGSVTAPTAPKLGLIVG